MKKLTPEEKFKALFPLKGKVTKEIIKTADMGDTAECIGAKTLKAALKKNVNLLDFTNIWGNSNGAMRVNGISFNVTTKENIYFMDVTKPQEVTFILS